MISVTDSGLNRIEFFRQKRAVGKTETHKIKKIRNIEIRCNLKPYFSSSKQLLCYTYVVHRRSI